MRKVKIGIAIFILLALQAIVYAIDIISRHGFDESWPRHARYHLLISGIHIITIALATSILALASLRKRSREGWIALTFLTVGTTLSWPVARLITREPTAMDSILFMGGALLLVLTALGLIYRSCFKSEN